MSNAAALLFSLGRPLFGHLEAERAHLTALRALDLTRPLWARDRGGLRTSGAAVQCLGLSFANRLGLAAGCDKNGDFIDALGALGFGHLELGAVTPRPQAGNPRPRLFRVPQSHAVVNRMGFNNKGVDHLVARLRASRYAGIRGVNIGKNVDTPLERAHEDYLQCFLKLYRHADYVAVNVSSPNTAGLRSLQLAEGLERILVPILEARVGLARDTGRQVPVLVKIAPDLQPVEIAAVATSLRRLDADGVIATNTTTHLEGVPGTGPQHQGGGLSGRPLLPKSLAVVRQLRSELGPDFPIIGVGGIASPEDAAAMRAAGADLLQLYTAFVYGGPRVVDAILRSL